MDTESCPSLTSDRSERAACAQDGPFFEVRPAKEPSCPLIFLCDHASNHIPERYNDLGLAEEQLQRHIAYDLGAAGITRVLTDYFGATSVLSRFSRLLIDPNRGEDDPTLIMRIADGAVVPGNRAVNHVERELRLNTFYRPYHNAVSDTIDVISQRSLTPVLISLHSFTESWKGMPRPWQIGILWDKDPRIAQPLLDCLRQDKELVVGDNKPYSGELAGDTMWRHGTGRGLPHALIEVRQDLIKDETGQTMWGERIAHALEIALQRFEAAQGQATALHVAK